MLQLHFISCKGVSGSRGNMRGSRDFCQSYLVLSLFYSLQRGSNGFIAEKTILILYQGSMGAIIFQGGGGGGCQFFSRGPNANFFRNPCNVRTCYFQGGVGSGPPFPLWIRKWAMSSTQDNIYHSPASNHNCQALICQD